MPNIVKVGDTYINLDMIGHVSRRERSILLRGEDAARFMARIAPFVHELPPSPSPEPEEWPQARRYFPPFEPR